MGPEEQDGLETSELGAERAGGGAPPRARSSLPGPLLHTTRRRWAPPRAGPSTPAWLRGSLAVGPPGGPWAGTGGSEADLLFRGVKVLPTLRKQHPSPGPRPAPFGSPDPSPLKRPPGRLQDLGRVCVTPETWDESRLPSGGPPSLGAPPTAAPASGASPAGTACSPKDAARGWGGANAVPSAFPGTRWGQAGIHGPWGEGGLQWPRGWGWGAGIPSQEHT